MSKELSPLTASPSCLGDLVKIFSFAPFPYTHAHTRAHTHRCPHMPETQSIYLSVSCFLTHGHWVSHTIQMILEVHSLLIWMFCIYYLNYVFHFRLTNWVEFMEMELYHLPMTCLIIKFEEKFISLKEKRNLLPWFFLEVGRGCIFH